MKSFIFFLTLITFNNAHALNYGKFKIVIGTNTSAPEEVIFFLDPQGETKIIENNSSYKLMTSNFFDMTTITIKGNGDEEWTESIFVLENNQVQSACASEIDKVNKVLIPLRLSEVPLMIWDKDQKRFVQNYSKNAEPKKQSCLKKYFERYSDYTEL